MTEDGVLTRSEIVSMIPLLREAICVSKRVQLGGLGDRGTGLCLNIYVEKDALLALLTPKKEPALDTRTDEARRK